MRLRPSFSHRLNDCFFPAQPSSVRPLDTQTALGFVPLLTTIRFYTSL